MRHIKTTQILLRAIHFSFLAFVVSARPAHSQQLVTHVDRIPDFGQNPTIVSVGSGPWSSPATWSANRVPAGGDVVQISAGTTVVYDIVSTAHIGAVEIKSGAMLQFRPDVNTQLTVGNFLVLAGGTLQVGTAATPVAPNVTANIVIVDQAINTSVDPAQYGNSLIALGNVTMHGAVKGSTFVRLAAEPQAGNTTLTLQAPVSGWRVGDTLFLPDSRQLKWGEWNGYGGTYVPNWEYPTIAAVSGDGRTITLTAPLAYAHPGSHLVPGDVPDFLPHVANLSRNVVVRSENMQGTRGYVMFTERANVDVRYVKFGGLGRTTNAPFDDTTFDASGNATHVARIRARDIRSLSDT